MRPIRFFPTFCTVIFTIIFLFPLASRADQKLNVKSGWFTYDLKISYDKEKNQTVVFSRACKREEFHPEEAKAVFPGFVEFFDAWNFCGPGVNGVVAVSKGNKPDSIKYEVYYVNPVTAGLRKIPSLGREIPHGKVVVSRSDFMKGIFHVFIGVRKFMVFIWDEMIQTSKPFPDNIIPKKATAVNLSLRENGKIEISPLLLEKGVRMYKGQRLYFVRDDLFAPLEKISCEGLAMESPGDEPHARTFPQEGAGFVVIELMGKSVKIPIKVI